jgi:hypothetical protein
MPQLVLVFIPKDEIPHPYYKKEQPVQSLEEGIHHDSKRNPDDTDIEVVSILHGAVPFSFPHPGTLLRLTRRFSTIFDRHEQPRRSEKKRGYFLAEKDP